MLTIATLAIHPFMQTIPITRLRLVNSTGVATLSRAFSFDILADDPQGDGFNKLYTLDLPTKGAAYAGLLNLTYVTARPTCPTGNCTWSPYTSLGVCSACHSVQPVCMTDAEGFDGPDCEWGTPNSGNLGLQDSLNSMYFNTWYQVGNYGFLHQFIIANFTSMYWQPYSGNDDEVPTGPPAAYECSLFYCVRTYTANVWNGDFTETLISTFPNVSMQTSQLQNAMRYPAGSQEPPQVPSDLIYVEGDIVNYTISSPDDQTSYKISNITFAVLRRWFQDTVQGSVDATVDPSPSGLSDMAQVRFLGRRQYLSSPS